MKGATNCVPEEDLRHVATMPQGVVAERRQYYRVKATGKIKCKRIHRFTKAQAVAELVLRAKEQLKGTQL